MKESHHLYKWPGGNRKIDEERKRSFPSMVRDKDKERERDKEKKKDSIYINRL